MEKYSLVIDKINADYLKEYLQINKISFEPSAYGDEIYFSITCTEADADKINNYIDELLALDEMQKEEKQ